MYLEEIVENIQLESDKFQCKVKLNRDDVVDFKSNVFQDKSRYGNGELVVEIICFEKAEVKNGKFDADL